jgi:hypothetical protein
MREEVPEYFADSGAGGIDLAVESTADWQLGFSSAIVRGRPILDEPPAMALKEAIVTARTGIPWRAVEKTVWVGEREIVNEMFCWAREENFSRTTERELLRDAVRVVATYCGELTALLASEHELERDRCVRRGEHRRIEAIKAILAGMEVNDGALGYSLDVEHWAATAWGPGAEEGLRELAEYLACSLLLTPGPGGTIWAWLGGRPNIICAKNVMQNRETPPDTQIALGSRSGGRAGFVESHNQAMEAERVGRLNGKPVTVYDEIATEAFALRDQRLARSFVLQELRDMTDFSERSVRLRETLLTYFRLGNNGSATAARLGVHERTVSYRLNQVEKMLGYRIYERRSEMLVALRLHALLFTER